MADEANNVAAAYQTCVTRWQSTNSVIWQLYAFLITAQIALAVALGQSNNNTLRFAVGVIGMGSLGIAGPLAIRSMQSFLLMENFMLDQYERILLPDARLRLHHRMRFRQRLLAIREQLDEADRQSLTSRRMTGLGAYGARADYLLDLAGQVANLWAGVIAGAGAVGIAVGLAFWVPNSIILVLVKALVISLPLLVLITQIFGSKIMRNNPRRAREYWEWFENRTNPQPSRGRLVLHTFAAWLQNLSGRVLEILRRHWARRRTRQLRRQQRSDADADD